MATITLVRHGQASFGADNYDQLSNLGRQQSRWLGEHWRRIGRQVDFVISGTMARHKQTTSELLQGFGDNPPQEFHAGLNEYDFAGLLRPLQALYPQHWCDTGNPRRDYYNNMKLALTCWMDGRIADDGQDSWQSFCTRINNAFAEALNREARNVVLVSSGGPIAVVLQAVLALDNQRTCSTTLQIKNTSTTSFLYNRQDITLDSFNDVSHLLAEDKKSFITFS